MTITKDHNRDAMRRLMSYEKPYLGLSELSFVLGTTKQNCANRRSRGKLPSPLRELAMGPIWGVDQIRQWLRTDP